MKKEEEKVVKNLKMRASTKVKAGTRLSMAEARVGELRSMPT